MGVQDYWSLPLHKVATVVLVRGRGCAPWRNVRTGHMSVSSVRRKWLWMSFSWSWFHSRAVRFTRGWETDWNSSANVGFCAS